MPENIYYSGDEKFKLPDEEVKGFLLAFPAAVKSQRFVSEKDTFDIPENRVEHFLQTFPDAKPAKEKNVFQKAMGFLKEKFAFSPEQEAKFGELVESAGLKPLETKLPDEEKVAEVPEKEPTELATQLQQTVPAVRPSPLGATIESFKKLGRMKKEGRLGIFTDELRKELEDKPVASSFLTGVFGEYADVGQELPEAKTIPEKFARAGAGLAGTVISFAPVGKAVSALGIGGRLVGKHRLVGKVIGSAETFFAHGQLLSKSVDYKERLKLAGQDIATGAVFGLTGGLGKEYLKGIKGQIASYPAMFGLGFGMTKMGGGSNEDAAISGITLVALHGLLDIGGSREQAKQRRVNTEKFLTDKLEKEGIDKPESIVEEAFKQAEQFRKENPKEFSNLQETIGTFTKELPKQAKDVLPQVITPKTAEKPVEAVITPKEAEVIEKAKVALPKEDLKPIVSKEATVVKETPKKTVKEETVTEKEAKPLEKETKLEDKKFFTDIYKDVEKQVDMGVIVRSGENYKVEEGKIKISHPKGEYEFGVPRDKTELRELKSTLTEAFRAPTGLERVLKKPSQYEESVKEAIDIIDKVETVPEWKRENAKKLLDSFGMSHTKEVLKGEEILVPDTKVIESEIPKLKSTLETYDSQIAELKKTEGNDLKISRLEDSKKRVQEILEQDNDIQNGLNKFTAENVKKVYDGAVKTGRYKFDSLDKNLQSEGEKLGINKTNFVEKFKQFAENPKLFGQAVQNFFKEAWGSIKKAWKDEGGFIQFVKPEKIKPEKEAVISISEKVGLDKNKIDIESRKYKKAQKKELHNKISDMIFDRRVNTDVADFESSLFIHGIENSKIDGKRISKKQLEVLPFLIEKTFIPKKLKRLDLEDIYKKQRKELTPIANEVKAHFDKMWDKIVKNTDQLSEKQIENYVTHIWDIPKNKKADVTNWFSTKNRFLNKRYIDTLEEGIDKFDLTPKLLNIADIIRIHDKVANSVIENTKFVNNLKDLTKDGLPLMVRFDKAPADWITTKHPALTTTMFIPGKEGKLEKLIRVPYKIHPDLKKPIEVIFGERFTHPAIQTWEKIDAVLKKTALSLSFFHHGALIETGVAKMSPIKVGKVLAKETLARQIKDRGKANPILSYPEETKEAISYGVQFGHTLDINVRGIQKMLDNVSKKTENVFVINRGTKALSSFNKKWDKNLWDYTHDPLKLYAFVDAKTKIPKNVDKDVYLREQAQLINDTFGGQNWDVLMVSPKTQQIMRWFLLSPDWTVSTVRQALSVTSFGATTPEGRAIRAKAGGLFWVKAGLYFGVGINMLNTYYRENDIKENPELYPKDMSRWDKTMFGNTIGHKTHLFTGRYDDGSERYMRWGKQFRELPELIMDDEGISFPRPLLKKIGGKTAPLIQLSSKIFTGKSPSGYEEWSLKDKRGWDYTWGLMETIAKSPLPFSTQSMLRDDKEWYPTDLAMPSSKGMTKSKSIHLFKKGIVQNDIDYVREVYSGAIRNNLDAYGLFGTALTIVKSEGTRELFVDVRTIEDAEELLSKTTNYEDRKKIINKIDWLRKELDNKKNAFRYLDEAISKMQEIQQ